MAPLMHGRAFEPAARPRLLARIERAARCKVTFLAAPAGYGKTIALSQYVATLDVPVLRIDLPRDLDGADGFVRMFGRALEPFVPAAPGLLNPTLERCRGGAGSAATLARAMLALVPAAACIAIDGLSAAIAADPAFADLLIALVESPGDAPRWLIAARATGTLPLASWMAYGLLESPVDERDLAFDIDEAAAVVLAGDLPHSPADIAALHELTAGWPTAFALAARSVGRADDVRVSPNRPYALVFEYLAEQVFAGLSCEEQQFLLATCALPELDPAVIGRLGLPNAIAVLEHLRADLPLILGGLGAPLRYQPLFRDFLEYQLQLRGEAEARDTLVAAARALEGAERSSAALGLALRAQDAVEVERLIVANGMTLLDSGSVERVTAALALLRRSDRARHPIVLTLRAMLESQAANFDRADALFEAAIETVTDGYDSCRLVHRYALELIKRNKPASHASLARILPQLEAARSAATGDLQPAVLGTIAIAHAVLDHPADAARYIARAIALVSAEENLRVQAAIYHQASYVAYLAGDAAQGSRMAVKAARIAVDQHDYGLAARSFSVQAVIASAHADDPEREFEHRTQMLYYAQKAGDAFLRREALAALLDIEAERGNAAAMKAIEVELEACDSSLDIQTTSLPPARALAATWEGDFRLAYDLVARSGAEQGSALRRAMRFSEIAVYGAASGLRDEATEAAGSALRAARSATLHNAGDRRRYARTLSLCSVAYILVGSAATANALLLELERGRRELSPRSRVFVEAVRSLYLRSEVDSQERSQAPFTPLYAAGYGGFARLFEALPHVRSADRSSIALLTRAEVDVLRVLARGGSSTKVAAELDRSVNTVNVHVKSIMRKLGCTSRYEAISVARQHGLIL